MLLRKSQNELSTDDSATPKLFSLFPEMLVPIHLPRDDLHPHIVHKHHQHRRKQECNPRSTIPRNGRMLLFYYTSDKNALRSPHMYLNKLYRSSKSMMNINGISRFRQFFYIPSIPASTQFIYFFIYESFS